MQRRLGSLAALAALSMFVSPAAAEDAPATVAHDYDWAFMYYMAYDNNLEGCGQPIIDMLKEGITSDRVAVVVSADFRNNDGMQRYLLTKSDKKMTQLTEEGIAEEEILAAELEWMQQNVKAKKYGIVFLNHGGQLGQMSYDERPGKDGGQNWLYPPEVGKTIAKWRKGLVGSEVELMFYQQCGKGTLENYYAMKDAAKFVMGSQYVVGAPNYYYAPSIKAVCEDVTVDGAGVAALFTKHETPNMFTTYSTFKTEAIKALPAKLDAVLQPLLDKEELTLFKISREFQPCFRFQPDELMFDAFGLLEQLYAANELDTAPLESFKSWFNSEMLMGHRVSPLREQQAGNTCGLSIFTPVRPSGLSRYRDTYSIYEDTQLDEFAQKLLDAMAAARAKRAAPKASKKKGSFK